MQLIEDKKHEFQELRKKLVEQLYTINPSFDGCKLSSVLDLQFAADKFSRNEHVQITNEENGIAMKCDYEEKAFGYSYFVDLDMLDQIKQVLKEHDEVAVKFKMYQEEQTHTEVHLILLYEDGDRKSYRLLDDNFNYLKATDKEKLSGIKFGIRTTGQGYVYIQNPFIYTVSRDSNVNKVKKIDKEIKQFNVIFIGDEFTTRSFEPEFNLVKVQPYKWKGELNANNIDLFFCESAWVGNDGHWKNMVGTKGPRNNSHLLELVRWCKNNDIPTIFWNKEDPFHYDVFIETAKHFDYVFTTDSTSIPHYQKDGCEHADVFPFAAQPKYHNPIEKYERKEKVVFAGAYYGDKFPERTEVMNNMIEISGKYGLEIFDRNYNNPESPNQFPERFKDYIVGTLRGDEIDYAYKGYKIALNVNSIVDSPTMFARRVFEILASNTPVVSSKSLGIENMFGDLVVASNDFDQLQTRISNYFEDREYYEKSRLLGLRKVLQEHTYEERIIQMLDFMNVKYKQAAADVAVVGIVKSMEDYEKLMAQFKRQTYDQKKCIILLDIFPGYLKIFNTHNEGNISTFLLDYMHHYNSVEQMVGAKYIAFFNPAHYYGENYLTDLMLSTKYVPDAHVMKAGGEQYRFSTCGYLDQGILKVEHLFTKNPNELMQCLSQDCEISKWFTNGSQFFNIDHFNFIANYRDVKEIEAEIQYKMV